MRFCPSVVVLCLVSLLPTAAGGAPPETLRLSDLVNRPDRWPSAVTLKKDFQFVGGKAAQAGQKVRVLEFRGRDVVVDAGADLVFGFSANDCDLLEAANQAWSNLTSAQRAVEPETLLQDASIWPDQVQCFSGFTLDSGKEIPPGGQFDLISVTRDGVQLYASETNSRLLTELAQTDTIARARQLVLIDLDKRPSRIVAALRGVMVDANGKPFQHEALTRPASSHSTTAPVGVHRAVSSRPGSSSSSTVSRLRTRT